jgi:hypothetical protein
MTAEEKLQARREYVIRKIRDALAALANYNQNGVVDAHALQNKIEPWIANPRSQFQDLERVSKELNSLVLQLDTKCEVEGILYGVDEAIQEVIDDEAEDEAERQREKRIRLAMVSRKGPNLTVN